MLQFFGIIAGVLGITMYIPYLRDIFRGTAKPERASWSIWAVLGGIAFATQLAKGATDSLWVTGAQTVGVFFIAALSVKYGMGGLTKRDIVALVIAVLGLVLWYLTREAAIALFIVIGIDLAGGVLTILKSYEDPATETPLMWFMSGTSGLFGALAVGSLNYTLLAYPVYLILINYAVVIAIYLGKHKLTEANEH